MKIEQFFDNGLAHLSYALISEKQMVLIDPGRDPAPYFEFAKSINALIVGVIETHPHADFISAHKEFSDLGIPIYVSRNVGAKYSHIPFDEGDQVSVGKVILKALNTPGHSPDSISIVVEDENQKVYAVFTGDSLFVGDVGRPDLREVVDNTRQSKENLAKQLYHSLNDKLLKLPDDTLVYPSHGAGSLCGKAMSPELFSTIGQQKKENYALQTMSEDEFVNILLEDQPLIPKYFPYDVELNRKGVESLEASISKVKKLKSENEFESNNIIIDTRQAKAFHSGHIKGAINIQNGGKFETWLGTIVSPNESFYIIASSSKELDEVLHKAAKIGYESNIRGALAKVSFIGTSEEPLELTDFLHHTSDFTIIDVRDNKEVKKGRYFENSLNIPLPELQERINDIPTSKPVVVHCAGGYRSAIGSSILRSTMKNEIYDLGERIKDLKFIEQV